mgnify:CR=1 FL=1
MGDSGKYIWDVPYSDIKIKVNNNIYELHKNILMYSEKMRTLIDSKLFKERNIYSLEEADESNFVLIIEKLYQLYNHTFNNTYYKRGYIPNGNISKEIDTIYVFDEYIIKIKSIMNEAIENFMYSLRTLYYNEPSLIYILDNEKIEQYEKDIDTFNTIIYDEQFYNLIKQYPKYSQYPNLSEILISYFGSSSLGIISLLNYKNLKHYPFIIHFLYDLCLKILYYKDEKYNIDILSSIALTYGTVKQLSLYIKHMSLYYKSEIFTVHNLLQKSGYPNLRSYDSFMKELK